jgi:hypothetical protein
MNNPIKSMRDRTKLFALAGLAVLLTMASGAVYGRWTQRWGAPPDLKAAADRLTSIPREVGDWRMLEERPMADEVVETLQCAGYLNRVYVNEATGATVNVAMIVGPPGPTAVHTPEICYSSRAYEITGPRMKSLFKPTNGLSHSLWTTTFHSRNPGSDGLRVYYGWSLGDQWIASESPRFEFGGNALLYKIQVAGLIGSDTDDEAHDSCRRFVDAFLEAIWKSPEASLRKH